LHKFLSKICCLLFLASCSSENNHTLKKAEAILEPVDESGVRGHVFFVEGESGVSITGSFTGLTPGEHGIHVHESGDCGGVGAANAGRHFNFDNSPHGGPYDSPGHAGDLGNVTADKNGNARISRRDFVITLDGPRSVVGKAIVIHKFRDDFRSQPSGNVGPGVACGLIVLQ